MHYDSATILERLSVSQATLYRLMKREKDPFPASELDNGRVIWSVDEVEKWLERQPNHKKVSTRSTIKLSWDEVRQAMLDKPQKSELDDGSTAVFDPMASVSEFKRLSDGQVRLIFDDANDAVHFKLRYTGEQG